MLGTYGSGSLARGAKTVYLKKLKVHKDRARVGLQTTGNQDLTLQTDQGWRLKKTTVCRKLLNSQHQDTDNHSHPTMPHDTVIIAS